MAFGHGDIDVIHRDLAAKALGQAFYLDCQLACIHCGLTSTGWPGCTGRPPGSRASALNTSFSRLPTLKMMGWVNSSRAAMKVTVASIGWQPSQVTRTFPPRWMRANSVSGTKKRTKTFLGGKTETTGVDAGAYSPSGK